MREMVLHPSVLNKNGFVRMEDMEPIKSDQTNHSFRILYTDTEWHIYSSFFGGRIGTFISIPGRSMEDWIA